MGLLAAIGPRLFNHTYDKCYCKGCSEQNPDTDLRISESWVRFAVHTDSQRMQALSAWNWDKAWHGTKQSAFPNIIHTGYIQRPGSFTSCGQFIDVRDGHISGAFERESKDTPLREGRSGFATPRRVVGSILERFDPTKMMFVTPSIGYASHPVYAEKVRLADGSQLVCVLEIRIKPGFYQVGKTTLSRTPRDPKVSESMMEWYSDRHGIHMVTAVLVRRVGGPSPREAASRPSEPVPSDLPAAIVKLQDELLRLEGRSAFSSYCRKANMYFAVLQELNINPLFLNHDFDTCFCDSCMARRKDSDFYFRGSPPKPYILPRGFAGFGVAHSVAQSESLHVYRDWHVCYHGVNADSCASILEAGGLLFPGSVDHNGREVKARDAGESGGVVRSGRFVTCPSCMRFVFDVELLDTDSCCPHHCGDIALWHNTYKHMASPRRG